VNLAGFLNGFSSGRGATEAVHAYFKEIFRKVNIHIENIAYQ
jgi:hypothetical protein